MRAAVIGAGPAGFYTATELLKLGFEVDLYDKLPTPYGLVRAGVAPDHPKIKTVTRVFDRVADQPGFRFYGGVELGEHIGRQELLDRYHAVIYTFGTAEANRLGIPGEELPGSHTATDFVGWYNAHPDHATHEFDFTTSRAVVIGNGNVAIDVARMLTLSPSELAGTDTAQHAIDQLAESKITEVVVLGRRGPAQAAFTTPELRELGELERADVIVDPADLRLDEHSEQWLNSDQADATSKRNVELLRGYAANIPTRSHRINLRFLSSPTKILADSRGRVSGIRIATNQIEPSAGGALRAVPTGHELLLACGLVISSVGYRGSTVAEIPFDERRGLIRNENGRVLDASGGQCPGEYVAGWVKRGASGVIGTNKKCAVETVETIQDDRDAGRLPAGERPDAQATEAWLRERAPVVTWSGWRAIDEHETVAGRPHGRPRVKLIDRNEMSAIATTSSDTVVLRS